MENVSKALLIVGAVLIGVLLLYTYNHSMGITNQFSSSYAHTIEMEEIEKYNADFVKNTNAKLNMYEVVSLMNKVLYIDEACSFNPNYGHYITVNLSLKHNPIQQDFLAKYWDASNNKFDYNRYHTDIYNYLYEYHDKNTIREVKHFNLSIDSYNAGMVSEITFEEINE